MNSSNFYKELLEPENNSDVSEVGPEDMANIVQGIDDIDDALFGFKPRLKPQEIQTSNVISNQQKLSERLKSTEGTQFNDFPGEDLLADISLSDDDFYDVGKKSSLISKNRDKLAPPSKSSTEEKAIKSKKIANLFGLNDDEDIIPGNKKKQEGAADWLGIKESPKKDKPTTITEDKLEIPRRKKSLTDIDMTEDTFLAKSQPESGTPSFKKTSSKNLNSKENESNNISTNKSRTEVNKSELSKTKTQEAGDIFDSLDDINEPKSIENLKSKKTAIFDELFGDSSVGQKKTSRRNSIARSPEHTTSNNPPAVKEDISTVVGQYTPSSGVSRRPGLGRRRDTTLTLTTPPTSLLFQENWLETPDQQNKKDSSKPVRPESKNPIVEVHDSLPTWLGGSVISSEAKSEIKNFVPKPDEKKATKSETVVTSSGVSPKEDPPKKVSKDPETEIGDTLKEVLAKNSDQSYQVELAQKRTETQLLAALELQTTQSNLAAVCARQRNILETQEKQLSELLVRQSDKQVQVEKQLGAQQQRIQQLLEILTANSHPFVSEISRHEISEDIQDKRLNQHIISNLEKEIHTSALENEKLKLRITLMEKHYKMEFESLQVQHRREIESLEEKNMYLKEMSDQLCEDYRERITRLKENEAELIAQHNERVARLREEKVEDMKQLMHFHQVMMEQMTVLSKLVIPPIREEHKPSHQAYIPLDTHQLSEREQDLHNKENMLSALQEKLKNQRIEFDKKLEEFESKVEEDKLINEETARQLKKERNQLKYQQQQLLQERKLMEEQQYEQRKVFEEMKEKLMVEQTQLTTEKLKLAEEKAKLDALANLQGVSGSASFDILQAKMEVNGALEAARAAEMEVIEEKRRLKEKERAIDTERWKLKEIEEDLATKSQHLDRLMQVSEANQESGQRALEEAKQLEKRADAKMQEVEKIRKEIRDKEKSLIQLKIDIAREEIRLNRKREQLEHILPPLSTEEAYILQPNSDIIDPKMLIMKLRAERELETFSKVPDAGNESIKQV